jgi:hypothetical protein
VRRRRPLCCLAGFGLSLLSASPSQAQSESSLRAIGGLHIGAPLGISGFAAAVWDRGRHSWPTPEGPFVGAEVGALGAIVSLGHVWSADGGGSLVQGGVLRGFRGASVYVGGDARFMLWLINFRGGAYARVRGQDGWSVLPVASIGVGF